MMQRFLAFFPAALLCASLWLGVASAAMAAEPWPAVPSHLRLDTPYGVIDIAANEYVYESHLRIDGQPVQPAIQGLLNITYAFSTPARHAVLVSIDSGDNRCPISYRWVMLEPSGHRISPAFGSCTDKIRVTARDGLFVVETPNTDNPAHYDRHTYDGQYVRRKTQPNPPRDKSP